MTEFPQGGIDKALSLPFPHFLLSSLHFYPLLAFSVKKTLKKHEQENLFFSVAKSMHVVIVTIQNNNIPHKL